MKIGNADPLCLNAGSLNVSSAVVQRFTDNDLVQRREVNVCCISSSRISRLAPSAPSNVKGFSIRYTVYRDRFPFDS
jgi:hypothetical protein